MSSSAADATRPEPTQWQLDPIFSAHVKLLSAQLALMPDAVADGSVAWLSNHPVRYVDIMGIVINVVRVVRVVMLPVPAMCRAISPSACLSRTTS